jgi:O-antigen biosynthesis protein WbqP
MLLPLFLLIVILMKIDSKGPIIFKQKRIGKNKKEFYIYKFRTMKTETPKETPTHLLENPEKWITTMGKIMRKTSIDEIPQFINILKGDMSFVGPRPALWNQYKLIEEREKYDVHSILPGITGWAQVNGRDKLHISEKAKLDGDYLEHFNLWTDIRLICKTFIVVLKRDGIIEGETKDLKNESRKS